jgi:hypothetical protein
MQMAASSCHTRRQALNRKTIYSQSNTQMKNQTIVNYHIIIRNWNHLQQRHLCSEKQNSGSVLFFIAVRESPIPLRHHTPMKKKKRIENDKIKKHLKYTNKHTCRQRRVGRENSTDTKFAAAIYT